eukprot:6002965-Amphidinium_carterae.1
MEDWIQHMQQSGALGGMEARVFAQGTDQDTPDVSKLVSILARNTQSRVHTQSRVRQYAQMFDGLEAGPGQEPEQRLHAWNDYAEQAHNDVRMLRQQLRVCKPRKSVPPWACPREAWLCVLDVAQEHNAQMNADMEELL